MKAGSAVPALNRALSVLEVLAESRTGMTLSEIARRFELPKSSTHLIVKTLEERGYLQRNPENGKYRFGLRLIGLGRMAIEGLELRELARPHLMKLARKVGLSVHLGILDGSEVVIVEKIENLARTSIASWLGRRIAVNCTSVGKCLVAYLPEAELVRILGRRGLVRHNPRTISSFTRFKEELGRVREQGWAIDDEEDEVGLRCIGAPVLDQGEKCVAAVSVVGTVTEIPESAFAAIAASVKSAAEGISRAVVQPRPVQ